MKETFGVLPTNYLPKKPCDEHLIQMASQKIEEIQVLRPTIHPADERKAILLLCATGQLAQAKKNAIRLRQYTEYSSSKEE